MNQKFYIEDKALPVSQDFDALKNEGLAFVQKYSKGEWTNFNPSDPGVTILDQVCYALTELGYCNDFPVEDILTGPDKKLKIYNQFYLPEEILTTSPLTIQDYRKYLIDAVDYLFNAVLYPIPESIGEINGIYNTYLYINPKIINSQQIDSIICSAYIQLNKSRNLGEIFKKPRSLNPIQKSNPRSKIKVKSNEYLIKGEMVVANLKDLGQIVEMLQMEINEYIFPKVNQTGYDKLKEEGEETNEIFNGPLLVNGWIESSSLGTKKNVIDTSEIINLFSKIPGIISVPQLRFWQSKLVPSPVRSLPSKILVFNIQESIVQGLLTVFCDGEPLAVDLKDPIFFDLKTPSIKNHNSSKESAATKSVDSIVLSPPLPKGNYRDISDYYSIQNTFPETYAVGEDSTPANASNFQMAQSRQLKGYLTLFDQVMANQFSQLANIDKLFSFNNAITGTPKDKRKFYSDKSVYQKMNLQYPVPYLVFSPTYYYQSLYQVPYIQPLLKNNEAQNFSYQIQSEEQQTQESWQNYQDDPYNSYIWGLMNYVEVDSDSLYRRDHMLDHLLSRYGYSPSLINEIIDGSKYTRDELKDKVIYKSLFLQNLGLLSYYRQKAYNFLGANKIKIKFEKISQKYYQKLLSGYSIDSIFDTERVDKLEKLKQTDFINYSTLELQMNLLLGLRIQYEEFIINNAIVKDDGKNIISNLEVRLARWMITQRKGVIAIESNLFLYSLKFEVLISPNDKLDTQWRIKTKLSLDEIEGLKRIIQDYSDSDTEISLKKFMFKYGTSYKLKKLKNSELEGKNFKPISESNFSIAILDDSGNDIASIANRVFLFFPDFIAQFKTPAFDRRLNVFLESFLPVQVQYEYFHMDKIELEVLRVLFTLWHNSLVFKKSQKQKKISKRASSLVRLIREIKSSSR